MINELLNQIQSLKKKNSQKYNDNTQSGKTKQNSYNQEKCAGKNVNVKLGQRY